MDSAPSRLLFCLVLGSAQSFATAKRNTRSWGLGRLSSQSSYRNRRPISLERCNKLARFAPHCGNTRGSLASRRSPLPCGPDTSHRVPRCSRGGTVCSRPSRHLPRIGYFMRTPRSLNSGAHLTLLDGIERAWTHRHICGCLHLASTLQRSWSSARVAQRFRHSAKSHATIHVSIIHSCLNGTVCHRTQLRLA